MRALRVRRHRHSCDCVALGLAMLLALPIVFISASAFFSASASLFSPLWAQERRHDPLNPLEIDQLRDAMMEPEARLKLYVQFSRDRMTKLEQMRVDPKTKDRARQTHDMLEDFLGIYDELNDNIDMYVGRKDDIRKPLKAVIEADTEFQAKLRALKNSANANAAELTQYEFLLTDALDTVDSSADDHRKTAVEVEEYMKKKKKQQK